jgi:hypothetical protein
LIEEAKMPLVCVSASNMRHAGERGASLRVCRLITPLARAASELAVFGV